MITTDDLKKLVQIFFHLVTWSCYKYVDIPWKITEKCIVIGILIVQYIYRHDNGKEWNVPNKKRWIHKNKMGKNTKTMEWMSFLLFGFIMTFICRVCTLMCELFKWMLFINLYVYPFRAYSLSYVKTDIQDSNEWLKFILRWKFHFAISFYWLPGKDSNRAFFPSVNYYFADWV